MTTQQISLGPIAHVTNADLDIKRDTWRVKRARRIAAAVKRYVDSFGEVQCLPDEDSIARALDVLRDQSEDERDYEDLKVDYKLVGVWRR